jgi:putative tryptophan/tyrosine transport system substrate-binding protein
VNRRHLILAVGAWPAIGWTCVALAQSKQAPVLIGFLHAGSRHAQGQRLAAFKEGFAALGWREGASFVVEEGWADGRYDRLRLLADTLAAKNPAVIVAAPSEAVAAAAKAAPTTPIIVAGGDPLAARLVSNLARPGGMITGVSNVGTQVHEKYLELLLDAVPKVRRIWFLADPNTLSHGQVMDAVRRALAQHSLAGRFAEAGSTDAIEPAMSRLAKGGAQALVVMGGSLFVTERQRIVKLALSHRWPSIGGQSEYAEAGALLAYGADRLALNRRAAYYVDRILKGTKPGDLPVEQPTKFELVINLKTAKALGLTIPPAVLARADEVIQ